MQGSSTVNPYPGIRPFKTSESHFFFGREEQIAELDTKLSDRRFVAVVGVSGSGKSSLVKAGLIPKIEEKGNWDHFTFRPESSPIVNLKDGLCEVYDSLNGDIVESNLNYSSKGIVDTVEQSKCTRPLLIIVDQFEELFRFKNEGYDNKEASIRFVNLLIAAAKTEAVKISVMITMRSDFLGNCSEFKGLPELVNDGQFLVPRLTRDQYREAIAKPFEVSGGKMSQLLVSQLLNDIEDDPDQLPTLQHALMRTWNNWRDHAFENGEKKGGIEETISHEDYEKAGGMRIALSTHADEIYKDLDEQGLGDITKAIFQRITDINSDGKGIRNPTSVKVLQEIAGCPFESVAKVVNSFREEGANFLMPPPEQELTPESTVDISHESLMRKWKLLKNKWIVDEVNDKTLLMRLHDESLRTKQGNASYLRNPALRINLRWKKYTLYKKGAENAQLVSHWAQRYSVPFEKVAKFLEASRRRSRLRTVVFRFILPALAFLMVVSFALMQYDAAVIAEEAAKSAEEAAEHERQAAMLSDSLRVQNQQYLFELTQKDSATRTAFNYLQRISTLEAENSDLQRSYDALQKDIGSSNNTDVKALAELRDSLRVVNINYRNAINAKQVAENNLAQSRSENSRNLRLLNEANAALGTIQQLSSYSGEQHRIRLPDDTRVEISYKGNVERALDVAYRLIMAGFRGDIAIEENYIKESSYQVLVSTEEKTEYAQQVANLLNQFMVGKDRYDPQNFITESPPHLTIKITVGG